MGYYTIDILPKSCDLTTIVTEFGRFKYNIVQMGMWASSDIFQSKLDDIRGDIKGFKVYIGDILVLGKGILYQHIDQLRFIFSGVCAAELKFNVLKCIFGLKYIPYLGCIITREGIKPDQKKVQGFMDLGRPTTMTEVWEIIVVVQY